MISKFELFSNNKINHVYITEIIRIDQLHMLDEYWHEKDTPYSDYVDLWPSWLFKYYNELTLGESIESDYLTWKS